MTFVAVDLSLYDHEDPGVDQFHFVAQHVHCAKSLQGEAPCGSAVYGRLDEMSPAPLQPGPPSLDPPPMCLHELWKTRRTRKNRRHHRQGTSHCSCLEHCFLFSSCKVIRQELGCVLSCWMHLVLHPCPVHEVHALDASCIALLICACLGPDSTQQVNHHQVLLTGNA